VSNETTVVCNVERHGSNMDWRVTGVKADYSGHVSVAQRDQEERSKTVLSCVGVKLKILIITPRTVPTSVYQAAPDWWAQPLAIQKASAIKATTPLLRVSAYNSASHERTDNKTGENGNGAGTHAGAGTVRGSLTTPELRRIDYSPTGAFPLTCERLQRTSAGMPTGRRIRGTSLARRSVHHAWPRA
jgi:hypothetical protein